MPCLRASYMCIAERQWMHGVCLDCPAPRKRHSHSRDILWRAVERAQIPAVRESINMKHEYRHRKMPDGSSLLPWSKGSQWSGTYLTPVSNHMSVVVMARRAQQVQQLRRPTTSHAGMPHCAPDTTSTHLHWGLWAQGTFWLTSSLKRPEGASASSLKTPDRQRNVPLSYSLHGSLGSWWLTMIPSNHDCQINRMPLAAMHISIRLFMHSALCWWT